MADRVKYFLLGLLFLVVAGVIAYDKWNAPAQTPDEADVGEKSDRWEVYVGHRPEDRERPGDPKRELTVTPTPPIGFDNPPVGVSRQPVPAAPPPVRAEPPPAPKKETPRPPAAKTHVIAKGDTLEAIALRYYDTRRGVQWIVEANGLKNADSIFENQKLIIPARPELKPRKASKKPGKVPSTYTVQATDGDLYAICRRFYGSKGEGARVARIMELNHLWSAKVQAGTILKLPAK